jgi:hypothetical protein
VVIYICHACALAGCKKVQVHETIIILRLTDILSSQDEKDLRKANDTVYSLLLVAVKDRIGFQAIRNGKDKEHPSGFASLALKNITKKTNQHHRHNNLS